eukprot:3013379-Amphidinium_carterae.1
MAMSTVVVADVILHYPETCTPWTRGDSGLRHIVDAESDPPNRPSRERWRRGWINVHRTCGGWGASACSGSKIHWDG